MSGIAALLIALFLLVVAIYSLLSYIRERRHSGLPSKKDKR
ncbi:small membrane protein [Klebsiella aerogenes]|nr:small membrane protein [Klebsiella aerogenes]EKZ5283992.1 small membrane protein [Klebsiella aerogenes]MCR1573310.1 small membrane protein [Klebsiella aerogenes]MCY4764038.1 small membrane protein [Klebsiella aerogenes]MDT4309380.1 small membrane protein [Klebsiella aerogenes]